MSIAYAVMFLSVQSEVKQPSGQIILSPNYCGKIVKTAQSGARPQFSPAAEISDLSFWNNWEF
jgi:hypothetical protein